MTIFGIDSSHFNPGDLSIAAKNGVDFVYAKASQGQGIKDAVYPTYRRQAHDAGLLFAAYHFLHSDSPVSAQADNLISVLNGDKETPVIIDLEPYAGSKPTVAIAAAFRKELASRGYRVTLLYIPGWYWNELGKPSLDGWDTIQSAYGSNPHADIGKAYPGDHSSGWNAFGGVTPSLWQYGSNGRVAGFGTHSVDVNAYRGTRADLAKTGFFRDFRKVPTPPPPPPVPAPDPKPNPAPAPSHQLDLVKASAADTISRLEQVAKNHPKSVRIKSALAGFKAALRLLP